MQELAVAADPVFVAVPLPALADVFAALAKSLPRGSVVTDLTSVKQPARELAVRHGLTFVGGHPMAGTAESGFAASAAELLDDAAWVLTIEEETKLEAWLTVAQTVTTLRCRPVPCTCAEHDRAVAKVSHLPHLLAAALTFAAADDPLALALAAGSFRDGTRVTASPSHLVAAMCTANSAPLSHQLALLMKQLHQSASLLGDSERLADWFERAGQIRRSWPERATRDFEIPVDEQLPDRLVSLGRSGGFVTGVGRDRVAVRAR
jgi:prephenate dehydrogenase